MPSLPHRAVILYLLGCLVGNVAWAAELAPGPFDSNHAMMRVYSEMHGITNYWVFMLDSSERLAEDLEVLARRLPTAAAARESVCISGPDPQRNRTTLERALGKLRGRDLMGLTVVYLGPQEDREAMTALVQPYKASLRYVVYPDLTPQPGAAPQT